MALKQLKAFLEKAKVIAAFKINKKQQSLLEK